MIHDPIVLDMTEEQVKNVQACCRHSKNELIESDGKNMFAAMGADPGVKRCPACGRYHWRIGHKHKCTNCGEIYSF